MLDTLKAIGIPVTAAAVISALVVSVPLLFEIDERYAKEVDLRTEVASLKATNNELQRELAQLTGFQQAMTQFILEGRVPRQPVIQSPAAVASPQPSPSVPQVDPTSKFETPNNWLELNEGLTRQKDRLVKPQLK